MTKPDNDPADAELRARLASLGTSLKQAATGEEKGGREKGPDKALAGALSSGFRAATDLAGGVIAGLLIGYVGDLLLGTSPVMLIVFMVAGTVAGLMSVYRLGVGPKRRGGGEGPVS